MWSSPLPDYHKFLPQLMLSSLTVWASFLPSDLSGIDPGGPPWLACLISFQFPHSFIGQSPHINIYCTLLKFCLITDWIFCFVNYFSVTENAVILILKMYSRNFDPVSSEHHESITSYITRLPDFRLNIGCRKGITTLDGIGIYRTNFFNWGRGGRNKN